MTESERKKIADLLESGMSIAQIRQMMAMTSAEFKRAIADELGMAKSTVSRLARG